jgi:hypothetical protein
LEKIILGDLAEDAAHDLARPRFGQAGGKLDEIGEAIGPISLRTQSRSSILRASELLAPPIGVT